MLLLMRVYFEKPRTTVGWKGLINDPRHGRLLPHREGHPARTRAAAAPRRDRPAGGDRGARPDHAAVPVGADQLDGDRRAHDRIADASRDGERPVDAGRLQERHGRLAQRGDQRAAVGAPSTSFPRHHAAGPVGGVPHARQSLRSHRAARRRRAHRTTIRSASRCASRSWRSAGLPVNIVVDCSHGNSNKDPSAAAARGREPARTRSSRAIARSSASCSRAT